MKSRLLFPLLFAVSAFAEDRGFTEVYRHGSTDGHEVGAYYTAVTATK